MLHRAAQTARTLLCVHAALKHWQEQQQQQPRRYIPARVVCHWLSELRHVRSHAHKEKEENLPHSGTRYTPTPVVVVPIYPHTHNNNSMGQHRRVKSHTANGFLVHHCSLPPPPLFFFFQYISASTFSFFSLLVHCARSEQRKKKKGPFSLLSQ